METGEAASATAPDELASLRQELEAARAEAAKNLEGWQRSAADFANYKKRVEREKNEMGQTAAGFVIARFLPVLDDFDRAMKEAPADDDARGWVEGLALIHRKLQAVLDNEGVRRMEAEGALFDPNLHEAITHDLSDNHTEGQIIEVVRQGYLIGERVLRPALVRVAK